MNFIREKREQMGYTVTELAEIVGVHFTTISEWELEKSYPRPKKRIALANVLETSVDELFPNRNLPQATHEGTLKIGEKEIDCAVLKNGKRVITQKAVFESFNRPSRGRMPSRSKGFGLPSFLDAKNLQEFINPDVVDVIREITYISKNGHERTGYDANTIPLVCDVYLAARKSGKLTLNQIPVAEESEMIVRSLSKIGIVALVDEATGYQNERDRDALHQLLGKYLAEERLAWAKMFPDEFYKQLYRLRGWDYPTGNKRPSYVGKLTNRLVYEKLPGGVLEELRNKNPVNQKTKSRQWKHHQFLSADIGQPDLRDHLLQLIAVMRVSQNWNAFERNFERAFPSPQSEFDLGED